MPNQILQLKEGASAENIVLKYLAMISARDYKLENQK